MIILPYPRQPIEYLAYDPRAPIVAKRVSELIQQSLPTVQVEHIGSTAAECPGRGAIDLMVLYNQESIDHILAALDSIGFQWISRSNALPDEWPKGAGAVEHEGTLFRIHLHVVPIDHPVVNERRAFRDRLRNDMNFREAYLLEKQKILAQGITDPIEYTAAKSDFVIQHTSTGS